MSRQIMMKVIATLVTIFSKWVSAATQINNLEPEIATKYVPDFSSSSTSAKASYTGPPFIIPPSLFPGEIGEPPKPRPSPDYSWRVPFDTNQTFHRFLNNNYIRIPEFYLARPQESRIPKPSDRRTAEKCVPPTKSLMKSQNNELFSTSSVFEGDATFFYPNLGACGVMSTSCEQVVALSHSTFDKYTPGGNPNENLSCGRKIAVFYEEKSVEVKIVDRLGGGDTYDISLSPSAFSELEDQRKGRIRVTWVWV